MNRRSFLKKSALATSLAGAAGLATGEVLAAVAKKEKSEYYELREYTFKTEEQQTLTETFWQNAGLAAYNRLSSRPVGLFREVTPTGAVSKLIVLIPFKSLKEFTEVQDKLARDSAYQNNGAAYLKADAKNPAYERIQSSLLVAFDSIPKLEIPKAAAKNETRIFELRRYESATEYAGKQKVKMFNSGGEIAIFRKSGIIPVFFGETLIGEKRPNLTYMCTYKDMEERGRVWKNFSNDPEWKTLSKLPEYANTVSTITATFLTPLAFSQI